jgi:uncharacterized protein (TIGR02147 family)
MDKSHENKPDIFTYHDFRVFLRDWLEYLRKIDSRFSLRTLAKKSRLSVAYLPMVFSGSRKLSQKSLQKMLPHLQLSSTEQSYFELICQLGQGEANDETLEALKKIQRFHSYAEKNPRETEVYNYLSRWYNIVIREMVQIKEFRADANWIHRRLAYKVPLAEVERALSFLISHGFIEVGPNGVCRVPERALDCEGQVFKIALTQFHKKMIEFGIVALDETPRERRDITGMTIPISDENFKQVRAILDSALRQIEELSAKDKSPDSVYHVAFLAYPMTNPSEDKEELESAS